MTKILVIGEECEDVFIYGKIDRLSPEAPVPVFQPLEIKKNKGMSGNVINNLLSLSNDLNITHWTQKEKITKTRYVEKKSNHMIIRIDDGELNPLENIGELTESMINTIKDQDIVIISDYDKGYLNQKNMIDICQISKLSIVDTKKILQFDTVYPMTWLKLNEKESENNKYLEKAYKEKILKTVGERGTLYYDKLYPTLNPKETVDVSGAGDTFTTAFILKYFETKNVEESIIFANEKCSIVVSKRGVSIP